MGNKMYVAAKALIEKDGKFLVLFQDVDGKRFPDLPGGRVQTGNSLRDTLYREVKEETLFDVTSAKPIGDYYFIRVRDGEQVVCVLYACTVSGDLTLTSDIDEYLTDYDWLSISEITQLPNLCHESFVKCLERFENEKR